MELIVAEKPKVAQKIAFAIGEDVKRKKAGAVSYYEGTHDGSEFIVAPAVGHVYTLAEKKKTSSYPVFDIGWVPAYQTSKHAAFTKPYVSLLEKLGKKADVFVSACDYDIEGCLPDFERVVVNERGVIRIVNIGKYIDSKLKQSQPKLWKGFEYVDIQNGVHIAAMNSNLSSKHAKIQRVMRKKGDGTILRITLEHGRTIHVTKNHPVFVFSSDELAVRRAGRLEIGDYLPAVRNMNTTSTIEQLDLIEEIIKKNAIDRYYVYGFTNYNAKMPAEVAKICGVQRKTALGWRFFDRIPLRCYLLLEKDKNIRKYLKVSVKKGKTKLPVILQLDRNLGKLTGYYLSEGCMDSSGFIGFYFGPKEDDLVNEVNSILCNKLGFDKVKKRRRETKGRFGNSVASEIGSKSKILSFLLEEVFELGRNSHQKRLPSFILSTPKEFRVGLLDAYLLGDGSAIVEKKSRRCILSAASVSRQLIDSLHLLLLSLGVSSSITRDKNRKISYLTVGIVQEINKLMGMGGATIIHRKKIGRRLKEMLKTKRTRNDILWSIPNFMVDSDTVSYQTKQNMLYGGPSGRTSITSITERPLFIKNIIDGDMCPFRVVKIEEIPYNGYIYDFQTETGSFMHGNGVITHNSTIAYNVFRFATPIKEGRRMKFSALTKGELVSAYEGMGDFDYNNAYAGEARHILDWYYGINLSRALMTSLRRASTYRIMSIGRVQGPALAILSELEKKIGTFVPVPYWELTITAEGIQLLHVKGRFLDEKEASKSLSRTGKTAVVSKVEKKDFVIAPPPNFDLTSLQVEAYRNFRYPPSRTLQIAQSLYEASLITYPRTSSQKIPPTINLVPIIKKLAKAKEYCKEAEKIISNKWFRPIQGRKDDPAHPAIHPTGQTGKMTAQEKNVYDLVVRRFFSALAPPARKERVSVELDSNGEKYSTSGSTMQDAGWTAFYGKYFRSEDKILPEFRKGEEKKVEKKKKTKKETKPPRRFSPASIVAELERRHLGTKATRSVIIDTLFKRGYAEGTSITVTDFGMKVKEVLEKYAPEILDEALTKKMEEKMERIQEGQLEKEVVIDEGREMLTQILDRWKKNEGKIGKELAEALKVMMEKESVLGKCDKCGKDLRIIRLRGGRHFVGCGGYPKCRNSYPLPPGTYAKPAGKACPVCGKPVVTIRKGRRQYSMCVDPDCPSKDSWKKKRGKDEKDS